MLGHGPRAPLASPGGRCSGPRTGPPAEPWATGTWAGCRLQGGWGWGGGWPRGSDRSPAISEEAAGRHVQEMLLSRRGCGDEHQGTKVSVRKCPVLVADVAGSTLGRGCAASQNGKGPAPRPGPSPPPTPPPPHCLFSSRSPWAHTRQTLTQPPGQQGHTSGTTQVSAGR